ncbi:hypothetical protein [Microcoleus sp. FACHB-672]|uniref:hypothetical protein n=1 Tax=Microcoleus sp. FACHB-672 TaxID=2692825 RepID=UPI0016899818|nr:hypothetical protein [Microcoleus sp. FACHB-672]MBD2043419.1 hypothetical protein [Microcoleus sp. FACHB-672]
MFLPISQMTQTQFLTPTEIAKELEKQTGKRMSAITINKLLAAMNLQRKISNLWEPTILGKGLSVLLPYIGQNNHAGFQLKWSTDVIDLLKVRI